VSDYFLSDIRFVQDQQLLLTASAPDPMIEDIAMCLWSRKISPAIITPKGHAMAAVFMGTQKPLLDAVFIHSEPAQTAMTLFIKSKPVMVRTIPVSNPSDETIAENLLRLVKGFRHRSGLETRFHVYLTREPAPADPIQAIRKLKPLMNRNPAYFTGDITPIDSNVIPLTDYLMRKPRYLFNWSQNKYGPGTFFSRFKPELLTTAVIGLMVVFLSIFGLYRNLSALEEQILDARRAGFEIYRQTFPENDIQAGHSPLLLMQARVKQAMQRTGTDMQLTAIEHSSGIPAVDVHLRYHKQFQPCRQIKKCTGAISSVQGRHHSNSGCRGNREPGCFSIQNRYVTCHDPFVNQRKIYLDHRQYSGGSVSVPSIPVSAAC
jgi:hypothetical protein